MTYLFYDLFRHPEWQGGLRKGAVDAVGEQAYPDYNLIHGLPVLETVVQEIYRFQLVSPDVLR